MNEGECFFVDFLMVLFWENAFENMDVLEAFELFFDLIKGRTPEVALVEKIVML